MLELEQQLAHTKALLLTMSNSAYDALIVMNERCEILAINNRAEDLFQRQRPVGETLLDMTGSAELAAMVEDTLTNREEILEEQMRIGEHVYRVRTEVVIRNQNTFVCLALEDITDLVRLNRARRDMVANISHELRTPIANIRLIIDGLFHETERPKRKKSINSLRAIGRETDALLWMAEELLDLSMIESGQAIMRMVEIPVAEMVTDAVERMYDQSDDKELDVVLDVPEDLLALCDRDKVRRVLVNLIHNAIKWSPPGEVITVQARSAGDEVKISVIDSGPGVPDDQTARIFERFYQVDSSRSVSEGTGLGLAICKHIVEAHGGHIWAEGSSKQPGGRFFFTLPAGESKPESQNPV
ncbi:MAG: cell wall metabolism sensor histidine kinase WalK [Anaerolineae bacterium]|nr:cell wall metabolism sensor histidine kinase WalK [Anaerolineae bacterium]